MNGKLIDCPVSGSPAHSINILYNYISDPSNNLAYTHIVAFGGTIPMLALPVLKAWLCLKAVTLLRGNDFDIGVFQPGKRQVLLEALKASQKVCVLYKEVQRRLSLLLPEAKVVSIPNGIDTQDWQNDLFDFETALKFRRENSIFNDRILVGIWGQLKEKKGIVFFLENLLRTGLQEKISILLVGDVEEQVQLWINEKTAKVAVANDEPLPQENAQKNPLQKVTDSALQIIQLPFKDRFELLSLYPACDFIALPSHYDGMPNVLLEAGALGIPAIAARTGGIAEVLPKEQELLTFYPGNSDQCRQAIIAAAELTKSQRITVGKALKDNIEKNFSLKKETDSYLELFTSL